MALDVTLVSEFGVQSSGHSKFANVATAQRAIRKRDAKRDIQEAPEREEATADRDPTGNHCHM